MRSRDRPLLIDDFFKPENLTSENLVFLDTWLITATAQTPAQISGETFSRYMLFTYGMYRLQPQINYYIPEIPEITADNFQSAFAACFGTGSLMAEFSESVIDYISKTSADFVETISETGSGTKTKNATDSNSGGVTTTADYTKTATPNGNVTTTRTPSGTVTTQTNGGDTQTATTSAGAWNGADFEGATRTVTTLQPTATETVTDLKVITETVSDQKIITERTQGTTAGTTDTRRVTRTGTDTNSNSKSITRRRYGDENPKELEIAKQFLPLFCAEFVKTFCLMGFVL